ncbi:hypothetical protein CA264_15970 [Pontibacter actiniarum]|uniref:FUSC family protein n=2 Tax=Pontibacter actiniarum TaxID=323450 RepID=A0A1X9YV51_9BACT|nr:hypothetical protein CA264_15970 [Pontibacter actiniarum]
MLAPDNTELKKRTRHAIHAGIISGVLLGPLLLSLYNEINLFRAYSILLPLGIAYVLVQYYRKS